MNTNHLNTHTAILCMGVYIHIYIEREDIIIKVSVLKLVKLQTLSPNLSLGSLCDDSESILESFEQELSNGS